MNLFYGEEGLKSNIALMVLMRKNIPGIYINVDRKYL
jgi:hypothetical protein